MFQFVQVLQQFFGVIGDFEVIHRDFAFLNQRARTPTTAIFHLFIGKHGLVDWVPVHHAIFLVHNAFFKQFGEEPLFPFVILRRASGDFAFPIDGKAQRLQLRFHVINIGIRPCRRSHLVFHCRIFGGQTKRIPAHGLHHIVAIEQFVA